MRCKEVLYVGIFLIVVVNGQTLLELIEDKKHHRQYDLSEFNELVKQNEIALALFRNRQGTVFAPTNEAMRAYTGPKDDNFLMYHLCNQAIDSKQFEGRITTELAGNPPLWITHKQTPDHEIWINNAKIVKKDIRGGTRKGHPQVLHIIDRVLEPVVPEEPEGHSLSGPDARKFLEKSDAYNIGNYEIKNFAAQVKAYGRSDIYSSQGKHTFFIPIDTALEEEKEGKEEKEGRKEGRVSTDKLDAKVIDSHVIPDHALFTRTVEEDHQFKTLAFQDMIKVMVTMDREPDIQTGVIPEPATVKSNTLVGDVNHLKGKVMAHILKANIPVRNGVIHLISKPLTIINTDILTFLKDEVENSQVREFFKTVQTYGESFLNKIMLADDVTLFAPSNKAFQVADHTRLKNIIHDPVKIRDILELHLLKSRVSSENVMALEMNEMLQVETISPRRKLYLNMIGDETNYTMTVEGGGVNATVTERDIGATNGIVHIIDRILGIPYQTVQQKLATDPVLSKSNDLARQDSWSNRFNDTNTEFTFFVPNNKAWEVLRKNMGSVHKKLFMKQFPYQVHQIMERHLIVNRAMTIEELYTESMPDEENEINFIQMVRDKTRVIQPETEYKVVWDNVEATVVRPDVECINGIIHVIDNVLLKERDVVVPGRATSSVASFITTLVTVLIVKFLM